jgi:xanthine dehydrogenase iron-sulfur cluster and FAD-binding subunit A
VVLTLAWSGDNKEPWRNVRLALGSVAPTTIRALATERAIEGQRPDRTTADRAAEVLSAELDPIDDVRSTADYRRAAAARVVHRFVRDEGGW